MSSEKGVIHSSLRRMSKIRLTPKALQALPLELFYEVIAANSKK